MNCPFVKELSLCEGIVLLIGMVSPRPRSPPPHQSSQSVSVSLQSLLGRRMAWKGGGGWAVDGEEGVGDTDHSSCLAAASNFGRQTDLAV